MRKEIIFYALIFIAVISLSIVAYPYILEEIYLLLEKMALSFQENLIK